MYAVVKQQTINTVILPLIPVRTSIRKPMKYFIFGLYIIKLKSHLTDLFLLVIWMDICPFSKESGAISERVNILIGFLLLLCCSVVQFVFICRLREHIIMN